jgi:D-3-phosphoglycerate dehydrogenase
MDKMEKWKLALTGFVDEEYIHQLEAMGFEVFVRPWLSQDQDDCIKRLKGMDAVLAGSDPFSSRVLDALKDNLKIISRLGIGVDAIDLQHAGELGIAVCNTPGMMAVQVAEHTMALILSLYKKIPLYDKNVRSGIWKGLSANMELEEKTIGLIGFGTISQKLTQHLKGFNCTILAYDPNFNAVAAEKLGVKYAPLDDILSKADIVSLHLPATPETVGFVDKVFLSKMKKEAILINTSRGPIVKEKDLVDALSRGVILGAGLDVMETEPPGADNPLYEFENAIISPHIGWNTREGIKRVAAIAAERIIEARGGKEIKYMVNSSYLGN